MKMKIEVTAEDIKNGIRTLKCDCPVALALKRAGLREPIVNCDKVFFFPKLHSPQDIRPLPKKVTAFIRKFDDNRPVQPFSFCLSL
jgi:hypothetical protein